MATMQRSGSSVDIHYTRNPHKANLCVEIRLGSAGDSAEHTSVSKAITRKQQFCSSPAATRRAPNG